MEDLGIKDDNIILWREPRKGSNKSSPMESHSDYKSFELSPLRNAEPK